jgi:hypothetical protein
MFARRLMPAVIVLAIAFAPVALNACQATCAMHAAAHATGHHGHRATEAGGHEASASLADHSSDHHVGLAGKGGATVTAGPHTCGHPGDLPQTAGVTVPVLIDAPAIVPVATATFAPPRAIVTAATGLQARDSVPIALTLPLRV